MKVFLELLRIIFIFAIGGSILGYFLESVYSGIGIDNQKYGGIGFIAILILMFVLYRNKLQFSGWYKGEGRKKLPKIVSKLLIFSSISLLLLPIVLSFLFK